MARVVAVSKGSGTPARRSALTALHRLRSILARAWSDEPNSAIVVDEPQCLSRNTQAEFELGANGNPFYIFAEHARQERVAFVASIEPDGVAEQT